MVTGFYCSIAAKLSLFSLAFNDTDQASHAHPCLAQSPGLIPPFLGYRHIFFFCKIYGFA